VITAHRVVNRRKIQEHKAEKKCKSCNNKKEHKTAFFLPINYPTTIFAFFAVGNACECE
jgi:hypothetical protein